MFLGWMVHDSGLTLQHVKPIQRLSATQKLALALLGLMANRISSTKSNSTRLIFRAQCHSAFSQIDTTDMTL